MEIPETLYAKTADDVHIAYVVGLVAGGMVPVAGLAMPAHARRTDPLS